MFRINQCEPDTRDISLEDTSSILRSNCYNDHKNEFQKLGIGMKLLNGKLSQHEVLIMLSTQIKNLSVSCLSVICIISVICITDKNKTSQSFTGLKKLNIMNLKYVLHQNSIFCFFF